MARNKSNTKGLSPKQQEDLLKLLKARFEKNMNRHKGIDWDKVRSRLESNPEKLWSLNEMEITGGEPDVVVLSYGIDKKKDEFIFVDCSEESPKEIGRASCRERV